MALINCSECGTQISDKANNYINCGNQLNHYTINVKVNKVQGIRKIYKKHWIIAKPLVFISLLSITLVFLLLNLTKTSDIEGIFYLLAIMISHFYLYFL